MSVTSNENLVNYYEVLEVSPEASQAEIDAGYQKVKGMYSPRNVDLFKTFSVDEVHQLLLLIEEAYSTVKDRVLRDLYDSKFYEVYPQFQSKLSQADFIEAKPTTMTVKTQEPLLRDGWNRTQLSEYQVDEDFEIVILNQDFFDGQFLAKVRNYKRVPIDQFSERTCINLKYLSAIESNNYKALPARVFTRGYIEQYCQFLNLDKNKVVSSFMTLFENGRS